MDIAALKKRAQAANEETWLADSNEIGEWFVQVQRHMSNKRSDVAHICKTNGFGEPEAQFIAAANPTAVLELIASHERLLAALAALLPFAKVCNDAGPVGELYYQTDAFEDAIADAKAAIAKATGAA